MEKKYYIVRFFNERLGSNMNKLFTSKSSAQMYCETSGIKKYKIGIWKNTLNILKYK